MPRIEIFSNNGQREKVFGTDDLNLAQQYLHNPKLAGALTYARERVFTLFTQAGETGESARLLQGMSKAYHTSLIVELNDIPGITVKMNNR